MWRKVREGLLLRPLSLVSVLEQDRFIITARKNARLLVGEILVVHTVYKEPSSRPASKSSLLWTYNDQIAVLK